MNPVQNSIIFDNMDCWAHLYGWSLIPNDTMISHYYEMFLGFPTREMTPIRDVFLESATYETRWRSMTHRWGTACRSFWVCCRHDNNFFFCSFVNACRTTNIAVDSLNGLLNNIKMKRN